MPQPRVDRPSTATLLGTVAVVLIAVTVTAVGLAPGLLPDATSPPSNEDFTDESPATGRNATPAREAAERPLESADSIDGGDDSGTGEQARDGEAPASATGDGGRPDEVDRGPPDGDRGPSDGDRGPPADAGRGLPNEAERGPPDGNRGPPGR
ncbi:hypothetical protein ACERIM_02185 [Natrinema sp. H-ect1]|uniref:hypothetical protein n=1 Tax=Natrinema sp. H-ect1 TaxID=3242700 RepID=UPI00359E1D8A